ncbi:PTS IIA-like nitrogen regulatory protein PtsN [Volucribacter amazonae]|uniref:PTS EIIA type-2 domain-containing protein n=1 Tax=Volucribacter amazonae TaxID=256731 RepID=A0A9X4PIA0_9PAST|nr:PTS IIA-like nitrogen regulatory protein PtsN [Volucribacter amazonae]MDG6895735.1 hypothetical protein [Volucribacter amazonae]
MKFTELLTPDNIRQGVLCSSKKRLLELVAEILAQQGNLDPHVCFDKLFNREKVGCTCLGNGVAIPHAKLPSGEKPLAVFIQLENPIEFNAADRREVDLFFAIMLPEQQCQTCLPMLQALAQKLTDKSLCKQLRNAKSAVEIWQIFEMVDLQSDT